MCSTIHHLENMFLYAYPHPLLLLLEQTILTQILSSTLQLQLQHTTPIHHLKMIDRRRHNKLSTTIIIHPIIIHPQCSYN